MAVLPAGTANVWAREARLPRDPTRCAAAVLRGQTVNAALARAQDRLFFLFAGAGLDARIVERVEAARVRAGGRGGLAQWVVPGWHEFFRRSMASLTVTAAGRQIDRVGQVLVSRVRSYASAITMPGDIAIGDGMLHVLAFRRRSKTVFLWMGWKSLWGRLRPGIDCEHIITDGPVRLESAEREPYHLDGDLRGELPLEVALTGRSARLIVP